MSESENPTQLLQPKDYSTNADLRAVLREVFESVIAERIEPRFVAIEARLDKLEIGQAEIKERLDKVEQRLDSLEKAFVKLERRFSHHQAETAERLTLLEDRVIDLETPAA